MIKGTKETKPQDYSLLPWAELDQLAEVYEFGAKKYSRNNWRNGYAWHLSFAALLRHVSLFWQGEMLDKESGLPHLLHAAFHCLTLTHFATHSQYFDHDDRPPTPPNDITPEPAMPYNDILGLAK